MLCSRCAEPFRKVGDYFEHIRTYECDPWREVVELKAAGKYRLAAHAANVAMGVFVEMSEEEKEERKQYYEDNKEAILARAKIKRMAREKLMEGLQNNSKTIRRKGY